jgi:hypothetical protein
MAFVGGDHAGHADRDSWSVGVRMDTHGGKSWLAEVAAHEVRHLAQSKDDEDDAKAYGRWAAGVLRRDHHGGLVNVYAWSAAVPNLALYGEAEPEDIIIAKERGKTTVWRNSAPRGSIRWVEYYPRCPV